jgi:hypothetical protein
MRRVWLLIFGGSVAVGAVAVDASAVRAQAIPYAASAEVTRDRSAVVAVTLLLPVGSRHDDAGLEGTAWLTGQTLALQANQALVGTGSKVSVSVGRSSTAFTLATTPNAWPEARATVESIVFRIPIRVDLFEDQRARAQRQWSFRGASPVTEFERESVSLLAPSSDPWTRSPIGTSESLALVSAREAELLRTGHYRRENAAVTVVGTPIPNAISVNAGLTGGRSLEPAWQSGRRMVLTREVTSAWITVAYAAPPDASRTTLEFMADIVQDALDPTPPDPERYSVDVRIVDAPGGPTLVTQVAAVPEAADRWERRIVDAVTSLVAGPPKGEFFQWARRRFRTRRLLADAGPEAASVRIGRDLLRDGLVRNLDAEIWALSEEGVAAALGGLGETRVLRLGPDLGLRRRKP